MKKLMITIIVLICVVLCCGMALASPKHNHHWVSLDQRVTTVEGNPLGGTKGQHAMWNQIHAAGVYGIGELTRQFDLRYERKLGSNRNFILAAVIILSIAAMAFIARIRAGEE